MERGIAMKFHPGTLRGAQNRGTPQMHQARRCDLRCRRSCRLLLNPIIVLAGPTGKVFVFEPRPMNVAFLKRHVKFNAVENVALNEAAVSDKAGDAGFQDNTGSGTGHLSVDGILKVVTIVLDEFVDGISHPDPDFLKMDIKGAEIGALDGARKTIERACPFYWSLPMATENMLSFWITSNNTTTFMRF